MEFQDNSTYRARPRFSLLTLVLVTTIVGLSITVVLLYRELAPLRTEVRTLREETGQLLVDDPTKLQAIEIETYNDWAWKWRVWVPPETGWIVGTKVKEIPPKGEFPAVSGLTLRHMKEGRETLITARIETKPTGELRCAIACEGVTTYEPIAPEEAKWLLEGLRGSSFNGVGSTIRVAESGTPFTLLRKRVFYQSATGSIPPIPEPNATDGLLIWLEEQK